MSQITPQSAAEADIAAEARAVCIARDNDAFRKRIAVFGGKPPSHLAGRMVYTRGVDMLDTIKLLDLLAAIRAVSEFDEENDPHGEHDFGAIEQDGEKYFWKIDIYADRSCTEGCEDPTDPSQTYRVLTVMQAREW